jgi:hypothetical protein
LADKRKERYQKLIKAGFSPSDARKMRSRKDSIVNAAIKEKRKEERNRQQRENYAKLRESGYTSKEATRFKKYKPEKVEQLTTEVLYEPIKPPFTYDYQSNYMYLFKYTTKNKEGEKTQKFLAIGSHKKLSRKELYDKVQEIFAENSQLSKYEGDIIIPSSIQMVTAYERPTM